MAKDWQRKRLLAEFVLEDLGPSSAAPKMTVRTPAAARPCLLVSIMRCRKVFLCSEVNTVMAMFLVGKYVWLGNETSVQYARETPAWLLRLTSLQLVAC